MPSALSAKASGWLRNNLVGPRPRRDCQTPAHIVTAILESGTAIFIFVSANLENVSATLLSRHKTTVGRALKLLEEKGMIDYLGSPGRSDTYRANCISGSSPPKSKNRARDRRKVMSRSAASEVAESDIRCCTEQQQVLQRAIPEVAESNTRCCTERH